jgi:hypothetical protein
MVENGNHSFIKQIAAPTVSLRRKLFGTFACPEMHLLLVIPLAMESY